MRPLADRPLHELLEAVAERTPAPGGGSSAAVACALAAGLVEMVAAFGERRAQDGERAAEAARVADRAAALRVRAVELAERELTAFAPVLEARRIPRADPGRGQRLASALAAAADPPLAIARTAAEVAELALEGLRAGGTQLEGDALTGALLAEGACRAAARLAAIDLAGHPDDARHAELDDLVERARAACAAALG